MRLARTLLDSSWTQPLPILAWLIEHPEGLIVVDSGETALTAQSGYFPRWHPYFMLGVRERVTPDEEIGFQVQALGFAARDVRWVVMTHLHTDHAGGLRYFPASEVLVTERELRDASGLRGRLYGYLPNRWPSWFDPTRVEFDDEPPGPFPRVRRLTAAGDILLFPTPGHTAGHMSVAVRMGEELVILAGDASYTEQLMLETRPDGVTRHPRTAAHTLRDLRELCHRQPTVYLPTHDPDSVERLARARERRPAEPADTFVTPRSRTCAPG